MMLLIEAQDIHSITLAVSQEGEMLHSKTLFVQPEDYLKAVDEMLAAWAVPLDAIDSVGVVTGPGSFTASRISVSIANAFAFARNLPVVGLENAGRKSVEELARDFHAADGGTFALPRYDKPPHITMPTN